MLLEEAGIGSRLWSAAWETAKRVTDLRQAGCVTLDLAGHGRIWRWREGAVKGKAGRRTEEQDASFQTVVGTTSTSSPNRFANYLTDAVERIPTKGVKGRALTEEYGFEI